MLTLLIYIYNTIKQHTESEPLFVSMGDCNVKYFLWGKKETCVHNSEQTTFLLTLLRIYIYIYINTVHRRNPNYTSRAEYIKQPCGMKYVGDRAEATRDRGNTTLREKWPKDTVFHQRALLPTTRLNSTLVASTLRRNQVEMMRLHSSLQSVLVGVTTSL
uniref:Uncharacterized protein n=1 Tax=Trypanosoma congolense (strain IL3000) TaxID=1068625 RepID=G0USB4_TRYCI|nr:hypothetical protein TCIL3000_8_4990 [Trypanosoma congolense IL3000]